MKTKNVVMAMCIYMILFALVPLLQRSQVNAAAVVKQPVRQDRPTLTPEPQEPPPPQNRATNTPRVVIIPKTRTPTPTNTTVATLIVVTATGRPKTATPRPTLTATATRTQIPFTPSPTATFFPSAAVTQPATGMSSVLRAACLPNLLVAGLLGLFVLIWLIRKSR